MNRRSPSNASNVPSRWASLRRWLELSPSHPVANVGLVALTLLAAGWVLQARVFGVSLEPEPHLLSRALLVVTPLLMTWAVVVTLRKK